jgi:hypothetical protein
VQQQIILGVGAVLLAGTAYRNISRAPAILRGDESQVPRMPRLRVSGQSYVPFLMWTTALAGCIASFAVAMLFPVDSPGYLALELVGTLFVLVMLLAGVLHATVEIFGWPRWIIAPAYRHRPSGLRRGVARVRRAAAGDFRTDHLVEIQMVRPGPDADQFEPFPMATCTVPSCDWSAFGGHDLTGQAELDSLRRKIARHTTVEPRLLESPL